MARLHNYVLFIQVVCSMVLSKQIKITEEEAEQDILEYMTVNNQLFEFLFQDYHKEIAPIHVKGMNFNLNTSKFIIPSYNINVTLVNTRIIDINEAGQIISTIVEFELVGHKRAIIDIMSTSESLPFTLTHDWRDHRLRWNPDNFSSIDNIVVPESLIWTPDFVFYDQASETTNLIPSTLRSARIYSNGTVQAPFVNLVKTVCILDMSEFPFDKQNCSVSLGTYIYLSKEISYKVYVPDYQIESANTFGWHGNGEWEVMEVTARRMKEHNQIVKYEYVCVSLSLQRHPSFFITVIILPCFILNMLCVFGMFIDRSNDTLNKMILGLTTLMAMTVELEIIAEEMPKSETLPLLADFVLVNIIVISIASVVVIFLPKLHLFRKSHSSVHVKKFLHAHLIFLCIFETANVWNFVRLLSYWK